MNTTRNTPSQAQRLITRINANTASKTKLYPKALDKHLIAARTFAERKGGRNDDGPWTNPNYSLERIWDNADSALIALGHYREAVANPNHSRHRRVRINATENNTRICIERLITDLGRYNGPR